jgi:putative ABC transport system permease protein
MSSREPIGTVERGLIFRLAASDLCHEWMLTLCLVLALAAVIAPLLLLFGLKFGTIETLRLRLIQDPINRELRPVTTVVRDLDWFHEMAKRPEVAFIIPTTRQIAAGVIVKQVNGDKRVEADLIPSANGDSLIVENGAPVPKFGEVVLTAMTAQALDVRAGDHVTVLASRNRGGDSERAVVEMVVVGIVKMRASGLKAIYAPLPFLEAVEAYKDGLAVPELGWDGSLPVAHPEYDGAIIVSNKRFSAEKQLTLVINTGFSNIEEIAGGKLPNLAGWSVGPGHIIYWLSAEMTTAGDDSLRAVRDRLRELDVEVFPWIRPLAVALGNGAKTETTVQALSVTAEKALQLGITPSPPWGDDESDPLQILLPANFPLRGITTLTTSHLGSRLQLPVKVETASSVPGFVALVPAPLAGVLRLAELRALDFDPKNSKILLRRRNYAGFRLYARTIDDVEPLRRLFADQGVEVHTEAQRIAEVTDLDRHLTRIFEWIAAVGVTGAMAALVANLYASIERKRRELGVLRLVGLSGSLLIRFPIYQSLLFVAASYGLASACSLAISAAINHLFRHHLQGGESFCRLPIAYQFASLSGALVLAALAASFAAWPINRSSTAAALREE